MPRSRFGFVSKVLSAAPSSWMALSGRGSGVGDWEIWLTRVGEGGVWFTERAERARLIAFLRHTEGCSGWPIKIAQRALEEDWGWGQGEGSVP